ncbi:MAG: T9SS type A sorting domain-containing protein [Bacteroidota bacterium]
MKKILLLLYTAIGINQMATAQYGILDPSFGSGTPAGTAIFSSVNAGSFSQGIAFQSDAKILITTGENSGIARLQANGTIDNSFGTNGWTTSGQLSFSDIIELPNGKIIAAGRPTAISYNDLYILCLDSNGIPDNSFAQNGIAADSTIGAGYEHIALQSGTKIIWSGALGIKRLMLNNGTPDASFGTGGFVRINQLPLYPLNIVVDNTTGNIIVGGITKSGSHLAITRLTVNGQVDATFGNNGIDSIAVVSTALSPMMKLGINSTGKIILASDYDNGSSNGVVCVRFDNNGMPDNSFGTNGIAYTAWNMTGSGYQFFGGLAIESNDEVVIACTLMDNGNANGNDIAIVRLHTDGTQDASFGVAKLNINNASENAGSISIAPDGKLIVNGSTAFHELVAKYTTGVSGLTELQSLPLTITCSPNPVDEFTTMSLHIVEPQTLSCSIYNSDGRLVKVLFNNLQVSAGILTKKISMSNMASGVYEMVIQSGNAKKHFTICKM